MLIYVISDAIHKRVYVQVLLARAEQDYPRSKPPPLRLIRSCSSALASSTLHKLEAAFKAPVLEVPGSFIALLLLTERAPVSLHIVQL